ncbi:adhesin [Pseudomonas ogarae]|uniref:CS1 type fimbrial major subunit n=1 Tax=Pseudomonas ogarae (strain DSM 112162 / CECT 30235 / F113) TaxID=1114970 RepID=UPI001645345D|nr:CS1 type fimbrial major subunit [Pseudomonas zarinae]QXH93829.1 adhesin [Pseudomonas zarinae]
MFRKVMFMTTLAALSPSLVLAADDARTAIHITANIPNKQFHVQPRNPDFGKDEVMHFDPVNSQLSPLRQTFDVKHTDGSVHAYLEGGQASLTNGSDAIPLLVRFNNIRLTDVSQEVVDDATSTPGTQADMHIMASDKVYDGQHGLYTADLTVIFDAVPRVTP